MKYLIESGEERNCCKTEKKLESPDRMKSINEENILRIQFVVVVVIYYCIMLVRAKTLQYAEVHR